MTSVLTRNTETGEEEARWPWRQRLERGGHRPRSASGHQKPGDQGQILLQSAWRECGPPDI